MSRKRHYSLNLKGLPGINISISKTTDTATGFKMTWQDPDTKETRRVNTLRVVANEEGMRPKKVVDIKKVLEWNEPDRSFEYRDESGAVKLLPIDKSVMDKLFTSTDKMCAVGFLPSKQFSPMDYNGSHYFITPKVDSKVKVPAPNDVKGWQLLYEIMNNHDQVLLVSFIDGERRKFANLYARGDLIMLSILIHSTYQRAAPAPPTKVAVDDIGEKAKKVLSKFSLERYNPEDTRDIFEEQLNQIIERRKEEERARIEGRVLPTKIKVQIKPVPAADDFFAMVDEL